MADTKRTSEIGYSGLAAWSGVIQEEFLKELRGIQGYKRYREMSLNSPVIAALLRAIDLSVRMVKWSFITDDGATDDERCKFLQEALDGLSVPFSDHISEALTMMNYGWSWFEIVYKRDGGKLLWDKFAIRGQDTLSYWGLADNGEIKGMWQQGAPTFKLVNLPAEKCIHYRTRIEKNNPEGMSILRPAWIPYYYWKNISQIEAIGVERDLAGLPHIELPSGATTDESDANSDASKANKLVRNVRNDEQAGIVTPSGWVFKLENSGGQRTFDTDKIINRYESRMLMSSLAQFLMLGQEGVGSLALSSDQTDLFTASVNAIADTLEDAFNKQAVKRLLELNGMDPKGVGIDHSPAGDVDLTQISDFLQKVGSMLTWTAQDEVWLRQLAKLPEVAPEDIEAEREKKQEQAMELARKGEPPQAQGKNGSKPVDEQKTDREGIDMEMADFFGAESGDTVRKYHEDRYRAAVRAWLESVKGKVIKGTKGIARPTQFDIDPDNDEQHKAAFARMAEEGELKGNGKTRSADNVRLSGGTEKQISWAENIRKEAIAEAEARIQDLEEKGNQLVAEGKRTRKETDEHLDQYRRALARMRKASNALWWIKMRNMGGKGILSDFVKNPK